MIYNEEGNPGSILAEVFWIVCDWIVHLEETFGRFYFKLPLGGRTLLSGIPEICLPDAHWVLRVRLSWAESLIRPCLVHYNLTLRGILAQVSSVTRAKL